MNKFILSLGLVTLLAGCGEPAKNETAAPQEPVKQSVPVTLASPEQPSTKPAAPDNQAEANKQTQTEQSGTQNQTSTAQTATNADAQKDEPVSEQPNDKGEAVK